MASVKNITPKNNLVDIMVEDGTGFIEVKVWPNSSDDLSNEQESLMAVPEDIE